MPNDVLENNTNYLIKVRLKAENISGTIAHSTLVLYGTPPLNTDFIAAQNTTVFVDYSYQFSTGILTGAKIQFGFWQAAGTQYFDCITITKMDDTAVYKEVLDYGLTSEWVFTQDAMPANIADYG